MRNHTDEGYERLFIAYDDAVARGDLQTDAIAEDWGPFYILIVWVPRTFYIFCQSQLEFNHYSAYLCLIVLLKRMGTHY